MSGDRPGTPRFLQSSPESVPDRRALIVRELESLDVTEEDLRLLAAVRATRYGVLTLNVVDGKPTKISEVILNIDLTKPLT